jgi:hypothetical protein
MAGLALAPSALASSGSGGVSAGGASASGSGSTKTSTTPTKAPTGASSATDSPTLKEGSKGHWVDVLQEDLTFAGFPTQVDGDFGPGTKTSVNKFKQAHGLIPNGIFQPKAWTALRAAVKAAESSVPAGSKARLDPDGLVSAPADAPTVVKDVIDAANRIATKPYCYGGGHASFTSSCYDCSGSVSYALHAADLLSAPEASTELESFGSVGYGEWITIYANAGHAYMEVAGLYFDTAAQSSSNGEDRWSATNVSGLSGYVVRHPTGY